MCNRPCASCKVCYTTLVKNLMYYTCDIVTDLINALPGNSSVDTVQQATIEEAVISVDPTDAVIDWLDSNHVICVYCMSMSVTEFIQGSSE
jgi:hypothetical protein